MEVLVELKGVEQIYYTGKKSFKALEGINLELKEGELVSLIGPSGCGKSTTLRIITGLQSPSRGEVICKGKHLKGINPYASIVFQTFALFPWLTVQENIEIALKARGMGKKERRDIALDVLDMVGLDGFESAYPKELSGGMRQKVGIARALAVKPEILCMDEPFSALDVLSAESVRGELLELWLERKIPTKVILLVTHNIEEAILMSDRIIIMDKNPGRIIDEYIVDLPYPRNKKSNYFLKIMDDIYSIMAGQTQPENIELGAKPYEEGSLRYLPPVAIGDMIGFLERFVDTGKKEYDVYRFKEELGIKDVDSFLSIMDALELLGFIKVRAGDIYITDVGEIFAEASILTRKEIFLSRVKKIPVFKWIAEELKKSEDREIDVDKVEELLRHYFPSVEIKEQLKAIITWGRYAELFSYDDSRGVFYLD